MTIFGSLIKLFSDAGVSVKDAHVTSYIEQEAHICRINPYLSYGDMIRYTLLAVARIAGVAVTEKSLDAACEASCIVSNFYPFPGALEFLKNVTKLGYDILYLSPIDRDSTTKLLRGVCRLKSDVEVNICGCMPWYSQLGESHINAILTRAEKIHPGIEKSQCLVITGSVFRTVEPCNRAGLPTIILSHDLNIETWVELTTTAPSMRLFKYEDVLQTMESRKIVVDESIQPAEKSLYPVPPYRIAESYQFVGPLGEGSFGEHTFSICEIDLNTYPGTVVEAVHVHTADEVAVKWEPRSSENTKLSMLMYEACVYRALGRRPWLSSVHWCGESDGAEFLVLDKLGANLEALQRVCRGRFSLKTTLMLADRIVSVLYISLVY